jgi:ankyrin repeat protein
MHLLRAILLPLLFTSSTLAKPEPCNKCELHAAASVGNVRKLKKHLFRAGSSTQIINQPDKAGHTPLYFAAQNNHLAAVNLLLEQENIDVNAAPYDSGATPLFIAVQEGNTNIMKALLSAFADPTILTTLGISPLHAASFSPETGLLEPLLLSSQTVRQSVNLINPSNGHTCLQAAAAKGSLDNVKVLLTSDGGYTDCNVRVSTSGATALLYAVSTGKAEIVQYLLTACDGIDIHAGDSQGWTPFMTAARLGQTDIMSLLLEYKDTDSARSQILNHVTESNHQNALIVATHAVQIHAVQFLLQQEQTDVSYTVAGGWNALIVACEIGSVEIVRLLLNTNDQNARALRNNGWSALHQACNGGFSDIVRILLKHTNHNIINLEGTDHHTPLSLAAWNNHVDCVQLLINDGRAELNKQIDGQKGRTALHMAAQEGNVEVVKALSNSKRINITLMSHDRSTPLDSARSNDRHEVERYLSRLMFEREREL